MPFAAVTDNYSLSLFYFIFIFQLANCARIYWYSHHTYRDVEQQGVLICDDQIVILYMFTYTIVMLNSRVFLFCVPSAT